MDFNKEQRTFINSDLEDLCLFGTPGGGKSTSIEQLIFRWIDTKILKTTEFLILNFTKAGQLNFMKRSEHYTGKRKANIFNTRNTKTFHAWAGALMKYLFKKTSSLNTVVVAAADNIKGMERNEIAALYKAAAKLKVIIVDEAQDMSSNQYSLVTNFAQIMGLRIILVGDVNQSIFQFQNGSDKFMLHFSTLETTRKIDLIKNYRSTPEIVAFANELKPVAITKTMEAVRESGDLPYLFVGDIEEISEDIVELLKERMEDEYFELSDLAIIGPVKKCMGEIHSVGLQLVVNLCEEHDIPYVRYYSDGKGGRKACDHYKKPGHVNIMTGHLSKGLEFEEVFVLNFNHKMFNCTPMLEEHNELKYLAYVMCTRAKDRMRLYAIDSNPVWPAIYKMSSDLYDCNIELKEENIKFREDPREYLYLGVTPFLELLKPCDLYDLEKIVETKEEKVVQIYDKLKIDTLVNIDLSMFFGIVVENIVEELYTGEISTQISNIKEDLKNIIIITGFNLAGEDIPKETVTASYMKLCKKCDISNNNIVVHELLELTNNKLTPFESIFINFLKLTIKTEDRYKRIHIEYESNIIHKNLAELLKLFESLDNTELLDNDHIYIIIKILFYRYQENHQLKFMWKTSNFDEIFDRIIKILPKIMKFTEHILKNYKELEFQEHKIHENINIWGIPDCVNKNMICDIKFSNYTVTQPYMNQLLMYRSIIDPKFNKEYEQFIFNVRTGSIHKITIIVKDRWKFYKYLSKYSTMKLKNMLFCYDLETTGLNTNYCEITERHFEEFSTGSIPSTGFVQIKGQVPKATIALNGITQKMVDGGCKLSNMKKEILDIIKYCHKPIFSAYNGCMFDDRIIKKLFAKNELNDVIFKDARFCLKLFITDSKYKKVGRLEELFNIFVRNDYIQTHRAKDDTHMICALFKHFNVGYKTLK